MTMASKMYSPPAENTQATNPSMNYPNNIPNGLLSMYGIGGVGAPGAAAGGQQQGLVDANQAAQDGRGHVGDLADGQAQRAYPNVYDTSVAAVTPFDTSNSNAMAARTGSDAAAAAAAADGSAKKESSPDTGKGSDTGSTPIASEAVAAQAEAGTATGSSSNSKNQSDDGKNENNCTNDDDDGKNKSHEPSRVANDASRISITDPSTVGTASSLSSSLHQPTPQEQQQRQHLQQQQQYAQDARSISTASMLQFQAQLAALNSMNSVGVNSGSMGPMGLAGMNGYNNSMGMNPMAGLGGPMSVNMNMNMGMMNGLGGGMNAYNGMAMMNGMNGFNAMGVNPMASMAAANNMPQGIPSNANVIANANAGTLQLPSGSAGDLTSPKRDSVASFMETLNRDSFLNAGMAGYGHHPGRDSILSRSSLAAGMAGLNGSQMAGLNASQMVGLNGNMAAAAAAAGIHNFDGTAMPNSLPGSTSSSSPAAGGPLQRNSFLQQTEGGLLDDQIMKAQIALAQQQQQLAFQQTYGTSRNHVMMAGDGGTGSARPAKKARKNKKGDARSTATGGTSAAKPKDIKWMSMLTLLKEYKAAHGDCIVPRGYASNPRLASWVAEQRKQYKLLRDGKSSNITAERVGLLQAIGFAWNAQEAAWSRHFADLQSYKARFGDCLVPLSYNDRPQLGLWVKEQRRHYMLLVQGRKSHMTEDRISKLEAIGFVWDSHEASWWDRYNDLKTYRASHGNCMVPTKYGPNPRLGTWVHHQRRQYRKLKKGKPSHMTRQRMETLTGIGFCWSPRNNGTGISEFGSEEE